jgi:para-nitrobenzyl esterase
MVWIHGGGMQEGYAHEMEFDGEEFASRGVILVSVGYRLNLFGFLTHPEITAESPEAPSNFALLDQAAAIKWVKRNIRNFGGDPENITIFGQSGGGDAVQFQLVSPQTKGDFQRAIIQSAGSRMLLYPPMPTFLPKGDSMETAYELSTRLFEMCGVKTLAEARKLDPAILLEKYIEMKRPMVPVIDGKFITELPNDAFPANRLHEVSLMVTATSDEFMAGVTGAPKEWVEASFENRAEEYWELVKEAAGSDNEESLRKAADYSTFNIANRVTAQVLAQVGRTVYFSEFGPTIPGDDAGAFHSCDLWFQFNTLIRCWRPFDGHHFDLARKMCNYFANFARTGDPNGKDKDGSDMPVWLPYDAENGRAMQFFDTVQMEKEVDPRMALMLDENRRRYAELMSKS